MMKTFERYAGRELHIDNAVFLSERRTGHRNRAIGHLMLNFNMVRERIEASDPARGQKRIAVIDQGQLQAALYISGAGNLPNREWLVSQLQSAAAPSTIELLAGRPATPPVDRGPIVCVCFDVGMKTILAAIGEQQLASVDAVGQALQAGTTCGSCRPAIRKLLGEQKEVVHG